MSDLTACSCSLDLDVDLARGVQQVLFPKGSPLCSWCCIGVKNRMAQGVGGDFFDFITLKDGCQMVVIGDVTGHGLQASLVMAMLYGYVHRATEDDCDPLRVAGEVNAFLDSFARRSQRLDHFFSTTFFCGIINPESLYMEYVNAGHVAPVIRSDSGLQRLAVTGPPLGYFPEPGLAIAKHQFQRGDRLLLVTDGIIEAFNEQGEAFGRKRLDAVLQQAGDHLECLEEIFAALRAFGAEDPPRDDCTAIVIDLHRGIGS
jgi:phosphoserine phosphatase RsbU/P